MHLFVNVCQISQRNGISRFGILPIRCQILCRILTFIVEEIMIEDLHHQLFVENET
jgi:hypothetical protein